ncbi:MAG TPA: hypothetical protein VF795_08720, partial [Desulfuromonadaceae bacterium]
MTVERSRSLRKTYAAPYCPCRASGRAFFHPARARSPERKEIFAFFRPTLYSGEYTQRQRMRMIQKILTYPDPELKKKS